MIMWFNVWFVIWPNQQKALNIGNRYLIWLADKPRPARPRCCSLVLKHIAIAPMLFGMVAVASLTSS